MSVPDGSVQAVSICVLCASKTGNVNHSVSETGRVGNLGMYGSSI